MDRWEALFSFWSSFGISAYEENSVPDADEISFPYITYEAAVSGFNDEAYPAASVWTRSPSWEQADKLSDAIENRLKHGGIVILHDTGGIWMTPGSPFSTSMGDPDDDLIKRKRLSVAAHYI